MSGGIRALGSIALKLCASVHADKKMHVDISIAWLHVLFFKSTLLASIDSSQNMNAFDL